MANKRKCTSCKGYFNPDDMFKVGLTGVCSTECLSALQDRSRAKRREKPRRENTERSSVNRLSGNIRFKIKRRDGKACRFCGKMNGRIEIHHIKYRSQGGTDDERNLITLCDEHHALMHSNKNHWQPVLAFLQNEYYENETFLTVLDAEKRYTKERKRN